LDESLSRLQQYTHDEGFRTLRLFTRLLNGVIYALVAVMVGYTVITFYMNYFKTAMAGF
jgi:type II secretory pathway component PulF